jgi:hypothetical protein
LLTGPFSLRPGESRALARKLGIGNDEGAGDAWNVAPAKAAPTVFEAADCGGVVRPGLIGPGDAEPCFCRDLFPERAFVVELLTGPPGRFPPGFCGVYGLPAPPK